MTFAPRAWAVLMIAAPDPGSRSTSRTTLAPLVSAWSAWLRCVAGSPCALTMVYGTPAFLNASARYRRSCVSQRTDDWVSGRSTATLSALALVVLLPPPLVDVLLSLLLPQAAIPTAAIAQTPSVNALGNLTDLTLLMGLVTCLLPPFSRARRARGRIDRRRGRVPRATRRDRRARRPRWSPRRPRPAAHSAGPRRAAGRAAGRRWRRALRPRRRA